MFTPADRERIRDAILARAREDSRITGGALTGSASVDGEDDWPTSISPSACVRHPTSGRRSSQ